MMKKIILIFAVFFLLVGCSSNSKEKTPEKETLVSIEKDLSYNIDEKWMARVKEIRSSEEILPVRRFVLFLG